jgi:hypothetical protein
LGIPVGFALISLTAHRKKPSAQLIGRFAFGILLGIGVFLLSNPTLYRNPFLGVSDLVSIHQRTALIQAQFLSGATRTLWEKWLGLSHLLSVHPLVLLVVIIFCLIECRRQIFLGPVNTLLPLWFCTSFFSVWLWLPFAWDRYALPALLPMVLLLCSLIKFHMRRYFEAAVLQLRERKP